MELNLFYTFIVLTAIGFLYRRFMDKFDYITMKKDGKYLKEFLQSNYGGNFSSNKPIAWIYLPFEKNAMNWESFYSRTSKDINNTLLREVINKNIKTMKDNFNVLLIDDFSFKYLLDGTIVDLETVGDPLKKKLVDLYILKLIKNYGGISIPNYFAVQNPVKLFNLLHQTTRDNIVCIKKPFNNTLVYDISFVGSLFNNNTTIEKLEHLQASLTSGDVVDESNFKSTSIAHLVEDKIIHYDIDESGVYDIENKLLYVEDFMSQSKPIIMKPNIFMVYIPVENLSKRTHYNWITYVSSTHPNQIGKFLL